MKLLKLERKEQVEGDEYPTYIFRVSRATAKAFENWCSFVTWHDENHISVSGEVPMNLLHDEFLEVGLDPYSYGL